MRGAPVFLQHNLGSDILLLSKRVAESSPHSRGGSHSAGRTRGQGSLGASGTLSATPTSRALRSPTTRPCVSCRPFLGCLFTHLGEAALRYCRMGGSNMFVMPRTHSLSPAPMQCEMETELGPEPPALPSALPGPCAPGSAPALGLETEHAPCDVPLEQEGSAKRRQRFESVFVLNSMFYSFISGLSRSVFRLIGSSVLINDTLDHCY